MCNCKWGSSSWRHWICCRLIRISYKLFKHCRMNWLTRRMNWWNSACSAIRRSNYIIYPVVHSRLINYIVRLTIAAVSISPYNKINITIRVRVHRDMYSRILRTPIRRRIQHNRRIYVHSNQNNSIPLTNLILVHNIRKYPRNHHRSHHRIPSNLRTQWSLTKDTIIVNPINSVIPKLVPSFHNYKYHNKCWLEYHISLYLES